MNHQEKQTSNEDLDDTQIKVWKTLNGPAYHKWPLSTCYLGAIRVIYNQNNPDRYVQAAHSLRELFEKLSWTFSEKLSWTFSENVSKQPEFNFKQNKKDCLIRLNKDKERYSSGWEKQTIDTDLSITLDLLSLLLNAPNRPSRMDRIMIAFQNNPAWFNDSSPKEFKNIWDTLESVSHHSSVVESECKLLLEDCDKFLDSLLISDTDEEKDNIKT